MAYEDSVCDVAEDLFNELANDICSELNQRGCTGVYTECEEEDGYKFVFESETDALHYKAQHKDFLKIGDWVNDHLLIVPCKDLYRLYKLLQSLTDSFVEMLKEHDNEWFQLMNDLQQDIDKELTLAGFNVEEDDYVDGVFCGCSSLEDYTRVYRLETDDEAAAVVAMVEKVAKVDVADGNTICIGRRDLYPVYRHLRNLRAFRKASDR